MASTSSSESTVKHMTVTEVKNTIKADIEDDVCLKDDILAAVAKLSQKKAACVEAIQKLRPPGRPNSNSEILYVTYLQQKIKKIEIMIEQFSNGCYTLQSQIAYADMWETGVDEKKSVDDIWCPMKIDPKEFALW
jgi:hypothetical protein